VIGVFQYARLQVSTYYLILLVNTHTDRQLLTSNILLAELKYLMSRKKTTLKLSQLHKIVLNCGILDYVKCPRNNFIKRHFNQYFVNNNNNNNNIRTSLE